MIRNDSNINETEIQSKQKAPLSILEILQKDKIIPETHKVLRKKFLEIIEFNKKYINEDIDSHNIKEIYKEYFSNINISAENKSKINNFLKTYKNPNIFSIYIDRYYQIIIEQKIKLSHLYSIFLSKYKNEIIKIPSKITSIKIYDFYQNTDDMDNILYMMKEHILKKTNLSKHNIKILTHLKNSVSFDFYQELYNKDPNISIKYIPDSASQNIYISSLFFIIIKYRVKNSNTYKELFLYLESNTNWALIDSFYSNNSKGFVAKFLSLLNQRFDEQYNKNQLIFKTNKETKTDEDFKHDINYIFKSIDKEINENKNISLNKDILKDIHLLKTKYQKIDNAYVLMKSYYYFTSYLNTISNIAKTRELPHTFIINQHINNNLETNIKNKINSINRNISYLKIKKEYNSLKKLRLGVIQEIDNKLPICDIFPNLNWLDKDNIISNLTNIANNENLLNEFYEKIQLNVKLTQEEKKEKFINKIIPNITDGKKVYLFDK